MKRTVFAVGRIYRGYPIEFSHCGVYSVDISDRPETMVDFMLLGPNEEFTEATYGLILERREKR